MTKIRNYTYRHALPALQHSFPFALAGFAFLAQASPVSATDIAVELVEPQPGSGFVYQPGRTPGLELHTATLPQAALAGPETAPMQTRIAYRWTDPRGRELSQPQTLEIGQSQAIQLPLDTAGHYTLEVRSLDAAARIGALPAGYPLRMGVALVDPPARDTRSPNSPFGMIHAPVDDPNLGPHVKRLSWHQAPGEFARELSHARAAGLVEVPLLHGDDWRSSDADSTPFSMGAAKRLRRRLATLLDTLHSSGTPLPVRWQTGLESNTGDLFAMPYFQQNFAAKLDIVRAELQAREPTTQFELMVSFGGFDLKEYEALVAGPAWPSIDVVSAHMYRWRNFPAPATWLPGFIAQLQSITGRSSPIRPLVIGEIGIPVRGQPDPDAFFGYPKKNDPIPGATAVQAASYMVQAHVLALASQAIERIYWYNYRNRGERLDFAEHHFGLRAYSRPTSNGQRKPGHPLPAYTAYATMVRMLSGRLFAATHDAGGGVKVYQFNPREPASARSVMVAWRHDGVAEPALVSITRLAKQAGFTATADARDQFGTILAVQAGHVAIGLEPVFIDLIP